MNTTIPNMILSQLGGVPFIKAHGLRNLRVTDAGGVGFYIDYDTPNYIMIEPDEKMGYIVTSYVYDPERHLYSTVHTSRSVIGQELTHAVIVENRLHKKERQYA